jgi:hypothetical protein
MLFDPLERFAELERLVSKIYFRFSHLFISRPELRDFWWEMGHQEDQHAAILLACKALIQNYDDERLDPMISEEKATELKTRLLELLERGIAELGVEEAFRIALQIEGSELDTIYSKLLSLGGPKIAHTLENLGVPASVQRQRLKAALRRFCSDAGLLADAERL